MTQMAQPPKNPQTPPPKPTPPPPTPKQPPANIPPNPADRHRTGDGKPLVHFEPDDPWRRK